MDDYCVYVEPNVWPNAHSTPKRKVKQIMELGGKKLPRQWQLTHGPKMPFWQNNLSGVCTENHVEIFLTKGVPWCQYQFFLPLTAEHGVDQTLGPMVSKVCS